MNPLATADDVADIWRPLTDDEQPRIERLIDKASAKLRQACPFDVDVRIAAYAADPSDPIGLDPQLVADRVAVIVARFLRNPDGWASNSETVGPYSHSQMYVNRYDKTGADVRGELRVIPEDIEELRPAVPAEVPFSFSTDIPHPRLLIPGWGSTRDGRSVPVVVPDYMLGSGSE